MHRTPDGLGLGWLRDLPDIRYFTPNTDQPKQGEERGVATLLAEAGTQPTTNPAAVPASVDLRAGFSPIEDQGPLGSCTANAAAGMVEYFQRKAFGKHIDVSRLFVYKATRNLLGWHGDTGAFLRTTMQTLALFGAPPEQYWPYDVTRYDVEPSAFLYAFGQDYRAIQYYRLDPAPVDPSALLLRLKSQLGNGLPMMFGFTVYASYQQSKTNGGAFPFPADGEPTVGGHAVVAAGYDDAKQITNANPGGPTTTGAFRIRNSWGTAWGEAGFGWLPYEYVLRRAAVDWWSLISSRWVDSARFGGSGP